MWNGIDIDVNSAFDVQYSISKNVCQCPPISYCSSELKTAAADKREGRKYLRLRLVITYVIIAMDE